MRINVPCAIDISSLSSFVALSQATRVPLLIWGDPGIGKTSIVSQYAQQTGQHIEVIIGSLYEPPDIGGNVYLKDSQKYGKVQSHSVPEWVVRIMESHDKGISSIVFFDEISTCLPEVQATMLRVINERRVADIILPPDTTFIAAANFPNASAGFFMSPALANRFIHVAVESYHDVDLILKDETTRSFFALYKSGWQPPSMMAQVPIDRIEIDSIVFRTPRTEGFYRRLKAAIKAAGINSEWWQDAIKRASIGNILLGDEESFQYLREAVNIYLETREMKEEIERKVRDLIGQRYSLSVLDNALLLSNDTATCVAAILCTSPEEAARSQLCIWKVDQNLELLRELSQDWLRMFALELIRLTSDIMKRIGVEYADSLLGNYLGIGQWNF